jgi:AraC-like DNA-binding protein
LTAKGRGKLLALSGTEEHAVDPRIALVVDDIEHRLHQHLRLVQLAAAVNLSPSRLAHLFRAETGVPPMQYLQARRMARARLLFERTFLTVKEVMALVGCTDPSHFARDFRRQHGLSPREWRARYGPNGPARPPPSEARRAQPDPPTDSAIRRSVPVPALLFRPAAPREPKEKDP